MKTVVTACEMFLNTLVPFQVGKDMVFHWIEQKLLVMRLVIGTVKSE